MADDRWQVACIRSSSNRFLHVLDHAIKFACAVTTSRPRAPRARGQSIKLFSFDFVSSVEK